MIQRLLRCLPLFVLLSTLAPFSTEASHIVGVKTRYECLTPTVYRVYITWYTLCTGASTLRVDCCDPLKYTNSGGCAITGMPFDISWCGDPGGPNLTGTPCNPTNCGCNTAPVNISGWEAIPCENNGEIVQTCGTSSTTCGTGCNNTQPGDVPGIKAITYFADFDFSGVIAGPGGCSIWRLLVHDGSRTGSITNLVGPGGTNAGVPLVIDLSQGPCYNNSVNLTINSAPLFCVGSTRTINLGAVDPDNDSLSFALGPCLRDNLTPVTYAAGFNAVDFVTSNPPVNVNPTTGDITITPTQPGEYVGCIYVTEWDTTVQPPFEKLTTIFDQQYTVVNCTGTAPVGPFVIENDSLNSGDSATIASEIGQLTGIDREAYICGGDSVKFCIYVKDVEGDLDTIQIFDALLNDLTNTNSTLPTTIEQINDSIFRVCAARAPLPDRSQPYNFLVRVADSSCPIPQESFTTVDIFVGGGDVALAPFVSVNCDVASFSAPVFGGGVGTPTYQWLGNGGLTGAPGTDQATFQYAYPDTGTYNYTLNFVDGFNCLNTASGSIQVLTRAIDTTVSITPGQTICQGDTGVFEYTGANTGASISWFFGVGATPVIATGPGPHFVLFTTPGSRVVEARLEENGCRDTARIAMTIPNKPLITAGPDVSICNNAGGKVLQAQVNQALAGCSYQWTPSLGLSAANVLQPVAKPLDNQTYSLTVNCGGCVSNSDQVNVIVRAAPQITFTTSTLTVCDGTGGKTAPAVVGGGTGSINYQWAPTAGVSPPYVLTPILNPPSDTTYTLIATDSLGCSDTASLPVVTALTPEADAGPDAFACFGTTGVPIGGSVVPGTSSGSVSYHWEPTLGLVNPNAASTVASPLTTTTYRLIVTDLLTGCASDVNPSGPLNTATVVADKLPTPDAGPDVSVCVQDSVLIGLPSSGTPVPGLSYAWQPTNGLSNPNVLRPKASPSGTRTYFLKTYLGDCESEADPVVVTVVPKPTVSAQESYEVCAGQPIQLTATGNAPIGTLSFQWEPATFLDDATLQSPIATPLNDITYTVYAVVDGNCRSENGELVSVTTLPSPLVDADSSLGDLGLTLCAGDSKALPARVLNLAGADPALIKLQWSPANGLSDASIQNPVASPLQSTVYTLSASYGFGDAACSSADQVEVFVVPTPSVAITSTEDSLCRGEAALLTAVTSSNAQISWSPTEGLGNSTGAQVAALPVSTTTYTATVTENNCTATATYTLVVQPKPVADFVTSNDEGCAGIEVQFNNTSLDATQYLWSFGDGAVSNAKNPLHVYELPGEYTVTLTVDAEGACDEPATHQETINVGGLATVDYAAIPDGSSPLPIEAARVQFTSTGTPAAQYFWSFGDGQTSTEPNPEHVYEAPGTYDVTLTVTDELGCTYEYSKLTFTVFAPEVLIQTLFTPNGDGINDRWELNYNGSESVQAIVSDRSGRKVFSTNAPNGFWDGKDPNGNDVPAGVYFYTVLVGDQPYTGTLTVLR